jgi:monoamine oxidase
MGRKSVVIVGGGVSGLSAALDLAENHVVTLLEVKNKLGGRIHTLRNVEAIPIELGAEFVHGRPPELMEIIKAAALRTHEVPDRHWKDTNAGLVELPDFWEQISTITESIHKKGRDTNFLSILESTRRPRESIELARSFVEGFHGAAVEMASAKEILLSEESSEAIDGQKSLRIHEGYDAVVRHLEGQCRKRGVRIHTSTEIRSIEWKKRPVTVHVKSRDFSNVTGDRVVVTLPIGVLRNGTIRFDPEPGKKVEAIQAIQPGNVTKVIFQFRSRFWAEANFGFLHSSDEWFPTWWTDERGDILTAWAGGPQGKALSENGEDFILERGVETASRLFGETIPNIRKILLSQHTHNWARDPFAQGAYSFIPVGALDAPKALAEPEAETIFFAGEATNIDHQLGTVHGAIASGRRAARQLQACN